MFSGILDAGYNCAVAICPKFLRFFHVNRRTIRANSTHVHRPRRYHNPVYMGHVANLVSRAFSLGWGLLN